MVANMSRPLPGEDLLSSISRWFRPQEPQLSPIYQFPEDRPKSTALVLLIGMDQTSVDALVADFGKLSRKFGKVIYVVTCSDFSAFRQRNLTVEHLPEPLAARLGSARPWRQYLRRRWDIILAKWQPDWILSYGQAFDAYLAKFDPENCIEPAKADADNETANLCFGANIDGGGRGADLDELHRQ